MMTMLAPDILDRRAVALLELIDPFGRPLLSPATVIGVGTRIFAKGAGRYVVKGAPEFEEYISSFDVAPPTPAVSSKKIKIEIRPSDPAISARLVELALPRNPDPAQSGNADSLFEPVRIALSPSPASPIPVTAAAARITVRKRNDGRRVANALVRWASDNGQFSGRSITDFAGEALLIVPHFPMSFTTGSNIDDGLAGKLSAVADPALALLVADDDIAHARASAGALTYPLVDPDDLASRFAVPASATGIRLSTRSITTADIEWRAP
jgi:hypothetical protein